MSPAIEGQFPAEYRQGRAREVETVRQLVHSLLGRNKRLEPPTRFFADGVYAYIEAFDNASIWYSSLAVELALILKLGDNISSMSFRGKRPSFKDLINKVPSALLDARMKQEAHLVRKLRNIYIHYYNILYEAEAAKQRVSQGLEQIDQKHGISEQAFIQELLDAGATEVVEYIRDAKVQKYPIIDQMVDKDAKDFIRIRLNDYIRFGLGLTKDMLDGLGVPREPFTKSYGIERFDALSCMNASFLVLRQLEYI
ncbi:MAG: hypothetical protein KJ624_01990 [Chloroflexi bacterium]|nr:hypothetical protein [Chloroflexota bacterium]